VSYLTNMQRKIVFAVGILLLFAGMYPYKRYLHAEAEKKDLGEATIGQVDTGSFVLKLFLLGGFRGMARTSSGPARSTSRRSRSGTG